MATSARPGEQQPPFIEASVKFLVDTGEKPVTIATEGKTERTGSYAEHTVAVHDGRPGADGFDLEREGFVLRRHDTRVSNFHDPEEVRTVYCPELEHLVKEVSGASKVHVFDLTLRADDAATRAEKDVREPVRLAHNDHTEFSGPDRLRFELPAAEAEALVQGRFAIINVWRSIRGPVETAPLALCDARTIAPGDLVAAERRTSERTGEIYHLAFNAAQRWFYFPKMQEDEALLIKCYDSLKDGRARYTAHAAFDDPTSPPNAAPRNSIEARTFAFF